MRNIETELKLLNIKTELTDNLLISKVQFPENFSAFQGHFDESPILPGVVSGNLIIYILQNYYNKDWKVKKISKAHFKSPIKPLEEIIIKIKQPVLSVESEILISAKITDKENNEKLTYKMKITETNQTEKSMQGLKNV